MSDVAKRLTERRVSVYESMKALADDAAAEQRNFDGEEQRSWDTMSGELDALDVRIKTITEGEERAKQAAERFDQIQARPQEVRTNDDESLGKELRSWLLSQNPASFMELRSEGRIQKAVTEARTLSKLSNGAGAYTVPSGFYNQLVVNLIANSAILTAGATVLQTDSGEPLPIPKTTSRPTGALVAEAGTIPTSEPVFGQVTLGAYKYGDLLQASYELVNDAAFDIESYLASMAGTAVGNALGADLINGNGSSKPRGLLLDTTLGVTGGTGVGGAPTADNLIDLFYSVIAPYRASKDAAWLMNDATVGVVRKFKDTTGQYLWQPALTAGAPDTLLGKPVYTDPNMPTVAVTNKAVVFGDLSKYFVRIAGGVRFERSVDFAFNTDLITFRALIRGDGALVDTTGAVKHFAGAAT